jgi:hypothetical protein
MAEEVSAFGGGTDSFIAGVKETSVEEAAEAAEGKIIAMMVGTNFFTFSKNYFSSERERPWEDPTFSQSISSPYAYENAMAPSAPLFKERPFI